MGKLKTLRTGLSVMQPKLGFVRDEHGHSSKAEPWRVWYSTPEWKRLRIETFERDSFRCQCGCAMIEGNPRNLVADHIQPHRGDRDKFFDPSNVQTLRKVCHDGRKQSEERRAPWQR